MKPRVYVETSVLSYLTARPSRDLTAAAWQQATDEWWAERRPDFELFVSEAVVAEARSGDPAAAARRLAVVAELADLDVSDEAIRLAAKLVADGAVPANAADDAVHLAVAAVHAMDFLLTWNCRHLDNAERKSAMRRTIAEAGYVCPEICSPHELRGACPDG